MHFHGKAVCCHSGCKVKVSIAIHSEDDRTVELKYSADVHHDTSYISARQVRGLTRKEVGNKLSNVTPSSYHHRQLKIPSDVYASGNRDADTANVDVLRKIKSEISTSVTSLHERKCVILSILHQKSKMERSYAVSHHDHLKMFWLHPAPLDSSVATTSLDKNENSSVS